MKQKSFIRYLDLDNRVRISFQADRGRIKRFVIQYETFIEAEWHPIIRYDTAHGFAHADLFHPNGKSEKILMETLDYNESFTLAQEDINQRWVQYLENYLRERGR
ncbi:MAG: hypothetical protein HZA19_07160 [Nitrospirae bacterium]|nr:hypothetical protein [Nitrospirota bacterium]